MNEVTDSCSILPLDIKDMLCGEIDNSEDLRLISDRISCMENKTVYMSLSTDMVHSGHIEIKRRAKKLGKLIVGVLSDEAVASYKRFPLMPYSERKVMFENIAGVYKVVNQKTLSYKENLELLKPDYVVHGDDWVTGFQKPIRDEAVSILGLYGGRLV